MYSTYLGGNQDDSGSNSCSRQHRRGLRRREHIIEQFSFNQGAIQAAREASNQQSGFVTKFNTSGSGLAYSTYLGGNQLDSVTSIALDSNGNAYATGSTNSSDFPITPGAFQSKIGITYFGNAQTDAFVSALNGLSNVVALFHLSRRGPDPWSECHRGRSGYWDCAGRTGHGLCNRNGV